MINAQPGGASSPKAKIAPRKFRRAGPRASFGQPPPVLRRSPGLLPQSSRQKKPSALVPQRVLPIRRTTALVPLGVLPLRRETTPRFLRTTVPNPAPLPELPSSNLPAEEFLGRGKHPRSALPSGNRPQPNAAPRAPFLNLPAENPSALVPQRVLPIRRATDPVPRFLRTTDPGPAPARGLPFRPRPLPPLESPSFFGSRRP